MRSGSSPTSRTAAGLAVHVDGARFANALARMNASPAQATWKAGVDVLSFGATKGGALAAEAVVFFDPARGADMSERRKRGGHLVSKHRFIAAQIEAYLADDLWLRLARHANAMADRLASGLAAAGLHPVWPVEANEVFVALPCRSTNGSRPRARAIIAGRPMRCRTGLVLARDTTLVRLVTSFATTADEVDHFVAAQLPLDATAAPKLRPIPGYRCGMRRQAVIDRALTALRSRSLRGIDGSEQGNTTSGELVT